MPSFYEFFAGGGMARAGLGSEWDCLFANDIDEKKGASYALNWGSERLKIKDVGELTKGDLPGQADLAWASFPCQDLSLAGDYVGLRGERSGTFWLFWRLMKAMAKDQRAPSVIVLENVCGALTSHGGKGLRGHWRRSRRWRLPLRRRCDGCRPLRAAIPSTAFHCCGAR